MLRTCLHHGEDDNFVFYPTLVGQRTTGGIEAQWVNICARDPGRRICGRFWCECQIGGFQWLPTYTAYGTRGVLITDAHTPAHTPARTPTYTPAHMILLRLFWEEPRRQKVYQYDAKKEDIHKTLHVICYVFCHKPTTDKINVYYGT